MLYVKQIYTVIASGMKVYLIGDLLSILMLSVFCHKFIVSVMFVL